MPTLTPAGLRAARMVANGLGGAPKATLGASNAPKVAFGASPHAPDRTADVVGAVRKVVGVQAQDVRAARLQVRARTLGATGVLVDRAVERGELVATWAMRGTLHLLAAEDVRWVVDLLGPRFAARSAGRRAQLGLDETTSEKALVVVQDVLGAGPMVRAELVAAVVDRGVRVDPKTQAAAHLVSYAAMRGLVCRGPATPEGEPTYVLLDDWIPAARPLDRDEALTRLAERYLAGFGPASVADFAAWSGLPVGSARVGFGGLQDHLTPIGDTTSGHRDTIWALDDTTGGLQDPPTPSTRLLGHFDTYLLGYRDRGLVLAEEFAPRIQSGGGFIMPAVLADGRVVGTWSQQRKADLVQVAVEPFEAFEERWSEGLEAEARDIGRFLGAKAAVSLKPPGR